MTRFHSPFDRHGRSSFEKHRLAQESNATTRSAREMALRLCVAMRQHEPDAAASQNTSSTFSVDDASWCAVGSSARTRLDLGSRARATAVRCCSPSEVARGMCSLRCASPSRPRISSASCRSCPRCAARSPRCCFAPSLRANDTFSIRVRSSRSPADCGTIEISDQLNVARVKSAIPRHSTRPSSGRSHPHSTLSSVVFPDPDGPTRATTSPG